LLKATPDGIKKLSFHYSF